MSLLSGREPARRRYLTLIFSDLSESTRISSELDPEIYEALLQALDSIYRAAVERHGGRVVRIQGDGMLAVFGMPETMEDDGRRAVAAALDLHAAVRALWPNPDLELRRPLSLHTGIHAGLVLTAPGDEVRGLFDLMGKVPNLAAHLADVALADEILVTEETLGPDKDRFVHEHRPGLRLRGVSVGVHALLVKAIAPAAEHRVVHGRRGLEGLVGRHSEFDSLEAALQKLLAQGQAGRIAIVGDPGLGKSRLGRAFLERCTALGCDLLQGYCEVGAGDALLQPFVLLLRDRLKLHYGITGTETSDALERLLAQAAPELLPLLPTLVSFFSTAQSSAAGPSPALDDMIRVVLALVGHWCAAGPVVLFIDDWQWADDASHRILAALVARTDLRPMILLATRAWSPADEVLSQAFLPLLLPPWSPTEAAQAVRRLWPECDPFVLDEICEQAGGNPLFIEELCHRARLSPGLRLAEAGVERSAWLTLLLESRVSGLPESMLALLRIASVLGAVFPAWLFTCISGCGADDPRLQTLADEDLLYRAEAPGMLRFKHVLIRDVVYQAIGLHQRRALHRSVVDALLQRHAGGDTVASDHWDSLAYHSASAGMVAEATRYAELAARRSLGVSALDRAQMQLRGALRLLSQFEATPELARRTIDLTQQLGLASVFDPSRSDLPLFLGALGLATEKGAPGDLARAQYWLAYVHYALGDQREALALAYLALAQALKAGDDRLHVQIHATIGQGLVASGRNAEALQWLDSAITLKQNHRSGKGMAVGLAYSLITRGLALADLGRFAESRVAHERAIELVGDRSHEIAATLHGVRAASLLWQGCWDEALEAGTSSHKIGQQVRSLFTLTMGRSAAAYGRWMLRRDPQALHDIASGLEWLQARGNQLFASFNHGWLAEGLATQGQVAGARRHAAAALRRARQLDLLGAPMACRAMASVAAQQRQARQAAHWLARARAMGDARGSAHEAAVTTLCGAEVAKLLGRQDHAETQCRSALQQFLDLDMAWHAEQANALLARL